MRTHAGYMEWHMERRGQLALHVPQRLREVEATPWLTSPKDAVSKARATLTLTLSHDRHDACPWRGGIWFRDVELPKGKLTS